MMPVRIKMLIQWVEFVYSILPKYLVQEKIIRTVHRSDMNRRTGSTVPGWIWQSLVITGTMPTSDLSGLIFYV
jgi:hypothetical protein